MAAHEMPTFAKSTGPRIDFSEPIDTSSLKDRSAIVTGGSFGIGRGCVEVLANAGAYVTFCDIQEEEGRKVEKELKEKGLKVQFLIADVTSWASIVSLFKAALAFSPSKTVDIVIPNAGVTASPPLQFSFARPNLDENGDPLQPPQRCVEVNYVGVFNTTHAALHYFKHHPGPDASKSKLVIFISSMGGYSPMPTVLDYNSAKWGVRGMFWSLRNVENVLGSEADGMPKFRVNLIAPSWVATNMTKGFQKRFEGSGMKMAGVEDVAKVALRMAADENVKGRAAAIAAYGVFDLCDDSEGVGVGAVLSDPEYAALFGYGGPPKPKENGTPASGEAATTAA